MKLISLIASAVLLTITGCSVEPSQTALPEVNDQNCMTEKVKAIPDKQARTEFASLCSRRPTQSAGPRPKPMNWFELDASKK